MSNKAKVKFELLIYKINDRNMGVNDAHLVADEIINLVEQKLHFNIEGSYSLVKTEEIYNLNTVVL